MILSSQTTEYYRFPIAERVAGAIVDPTSAGVSFSLVPAGEEPGTWIAGVWETDASTDPDTYYARVLFGTGGLVIADLEGEYDLFIRLALAPESLIRKISRVIIQ